MESIHLYSVFKDFKLKFVPPQDNSGPIALLHAEREYGLPFANREHIADIGYCPWIEVFELI